MYIKMRGSKTYKYCKCLASSHKTKNTLIFALNFRSHVYEVVFLLFLPAPHPSNIFVLLPVSLTDARYFFVSVHFPWPSVSTAAASSFEKVPAYCCPCDKICPHITAGSSVLVHYGYWKSYSIIGNCSVGE